MKEAITNSSPDALSTVDIAQLWYPGLNSQFDDWCTKPRSWDYARSARDIPSIPVFWMFHDLNTLLHTAVRRPRAVLSDDPLIRAVATLADCESSKRPRISPDPLAFGCNIVELGIAAALAQQEMSKIRNDRQRPAIILDGADGEPLIFQKNVGSPNALVLRDGELQTESGLLSLPAEAIVRVVYDRSQRELSRQRIQRHEYRYIHHPKSPQNAYRGTNLVRVSARAAGIVGVDFLRFSAALLPEILRNAWVERGVEGYPKRFASHEDAAKRLTAAAVGRRVLELCSCLRSAIDEDL
jgi:hypothetical protein